MAGSRCLWVALAILLTAASSAQEDDCCPPHKKTTTTTHHTTTPQTTTRLTTHPHTNHTTALTTANHTSAPHTTANHTTATHMTANHTSAPHTTANHTTATPMTANHTSAPHTTANHTTATHMTANHTSAPHTTANHTTATHMTANHTSAPHTTGSHTTANTTSNHTAPPHTTHHTAAPNTTVVPTKSPDIDVGEYTVSNGSEICLRVKLGLKLWIRYKGNGSQQVWGSMLVPGPALTTPSGNCSNQTATLRLTFPEGFVQFIFQKNVAKQYVYLSDILVSVNHTFPHSNETSFHAQNSSLHEFETLLGRSYQCKNVTIDVSSDVSLNMVQEQVQAFELKNGEFGRADHCPSDQPSMAVPIIVGIILAVLIIIVVVAYLIGRRRSHGGYQSI